MRTRQRAPLPQLRDWTLSESARSQVPVVVRPVDGRSVWDTGAAWSHEICVCGLPSYNPRHSPRCGGCHRPRMCGAPEWTACPMPKCGFVCPDCAPTHAHVTRVPRPLEHLRPPKPATCLRCRYHVEEGVTACTRCGTQVVRCAGCDDPRGLYDRPWRVCAAGVAGCGPYCELCSEAGVVRHAHG